MNTTGIYLKMTWSHVKLHDWAERLLIIVMLYTTKHLKSNTFHVFKTPDH